jgi:hypothetical protein
MMGWRAASAVDARADDDGAKAAVDATAEARTSLDMRAMAAAGDDAGGSVQAARSFSDAMFASTRAVVAD